jgi:hypothetical protein
VTGARSFSPRRRAALLALAAWGTGARAAGSTLPAPASLLDEAAAARARGKALVVMVSLQGCPHCHLVRTGYLVPLRAEGQPVVQVDLGSAQRLLDFAGQPATHQALVAGWGIRVAPTVLFVGTGGRELAPRLVGAGIPDFYGAYLDERVRQANRTASG